MLIWCITVTCSVRLPAPERHKRMVGFEAERRTEVSLDYLMLERYFELSAMDRCFEKQDKPTVLFVFRKEVPAVACG